MKNLFNIMSISCAAILFLPILANATLMGDSVCAQLRPGYCCAEEFNGAFGRIDQNFTSPAVVGEGVEFYAIATDEYTQEWVIFVDIDALSFTVSFLENTWPGYGNIGHREGCDIIGTVLSDLDLGMPIADVSLDSYTTTWEWASDEKPMITQIEFGANDIDIGFQGMHYGDAYTFSIRPVPEPSTLLLLGFGLVGFARISRKFRKR